MNKSQQMTREDLTISQNLNFSFGETQESYFYYFCQKFNDYTRIFFQFQGVMSLENCKTQKLTVHFTRCHIFSLSSDGA